MGENVLIVEKEESICTITFNRPKQRNSLTPEQLLQLADALKQLQAGNQTRVLVFRGAGDKAFSAGYDIGRFPSEDGAQGPGQAKERQTTARAMEDPYESVTEAIRDFPYPTIAMINGFCMGAGCGLAATCDLRIASDTSIFSMPPAKLGMIYSPEGVQRFINLVGLGWTNYLFFSGRTVDAAKAKEIGLVQEVVPQDQLVPATYDLARDIAENAPLSVKGTKLLITRLLSHQQAGDETRRLFEALFTECLTSEDLQEGRRAFLEKRKPTFQGR